MATLTSIRKKINATKSLYTKKFKSGKTLKGRVTRGDILKVLNHYKDPKKEKENVEKFLDSLDEGIIDHEGKMKILNDLESYNTPYRLKEKRKKWAKFLKERTDD